MTNTSINWFLHGFYLANRVGNKSNKITALAFQSRIIKRIHMTFIKAKTVMVIHCSSRIEIIINSFTLFSSENNLTEVNVLRKVK